MGIFPRKMPIVISGVLDPRLARRDRPPYAPDRSSRPLQQPRCINKIIRVIMAIPPHSFVLVSPVTSGVTGYARISSSDPNEFLGLVPPSGFLSAFIHCLRAAHARLLTDVRRVILAFSANSPSHLDLALPAHRHLGKGMIRLTARSEYRSIAEPRRWASRTGCPSD